jgi:hypothetical protein
MPPLPLSWLLQAPAFVRYRSLIDLAGKSADDADAKAAYAEMLSDPLVEDLVGELNRWEKQPTITRHNDAAHPLHRLVFAADIGIKRAALAKAVKALLAHQSDEGPFQIRIMIPKGFGGDGRTQWDWVATDAPLLLFALLRLGIHTKQVLRGVEHILARTAENGFPCFASQALGKFKGPGRRTDPCPYANLIILRMLAEIPDRVESLEARRAVAMLLHHWEVRGKQKYFLFGIGTDFAKPKAPLVWYDIMHFVDTLTRFPFACRDARLREVVDQLAKQADGEGRLVSASIWTKWKGWEFCQKKEPSAWLTFLLHRALRRMEAAA